MIPQARAAAKPVDEAARLLALTELEILDSAREQRFDSIVALAAEICGTPIGAITLIDADRQWIKAALGVGGLKETPREASVCTHAILGDGTLVIPDLTKDARTAALPMVQDGLRFYAGAPLRTRSGHKVGTLCVLDTKPGSMSESQLRALRMLADQVEVDLAVRATSLADERRQVIVERELESIAQTKTAQVDFLENVIALAPVMVFTLDVKGRFVVAEGGAVDSIGLFPHAKGRLASDVYRDHPEALRVVARALAGETFSSPLSFRDVHLDAHVVPLHDDAGAYAGSLAIAVDVTSRRRAEAREAMVRRATDVARDASSLREAVPLVLHVLVDEGRWSGGMLWAPVGDGSLELQASAGCGAAVQGVARLRQAARSVLGSAKAVWDDEVGDAKASSGVAFAIHVGGEVRGVVQLVSLKQRAEDTDELEALSALGGQLGELVGRRLAQDQLRVSEERQLIRDELTEMIAHDLKNPLSIVASSLEYVRAEVVTADAELSQAMADASVAAQRALDLVRGLVTQIGLESGHFAVQLHDVDLGALLLPLVDSRRRLARSRGIALECAIEAGLVARLDRELIGRVVDNLVDNAMRYVPVGGCIAIEATRVADRVRLTIGNSGPPIRPEERAHIFEKYAQTVPSEKRLNVGLGLYFCDLAMRAVGGTIAVADPSVLPVMFVLDLPVR